MRKSTILRGFYHHNEFNFKINKEREKIVEVLRKCIIELIFGASETIEEK